MELLMVGDVAKELEVSPDTVRLYERTGRLPALKTSNGVRLFRRTDVERFRAARMQQSVAADKPESGVFG